MSDLGDIFNFHVEFTVLTFAFRSNLRLLVFPNVRIAKKKKEFLDQKKIGMQSPSFEFQSQEASSLAESLLSRFISLRRLNRLAQFRNRKIRDRVSRERAIVEERSLQLQNVKSEIEHLQKEIERCYDFRQIFFPSCIPAV